MQATNKSDAAQVYEGAARGTKVGVKEFFKHILKPFSIFTYHYFIEGIKAVKNDGPTKELEKITNLSYDETVMVMEKCQKDGIKVVASERKIISEDNEFGKKKTLFQQKRITRYARRIRTLSDIKARFPKIAEKINLAKLIKEYEEKQRKQIESHKEKKYNIYFNASKKGYMGNRIADIIEYRTKVSKELFDDNTIKSIEEAKQQNGMTINAQQLKDLSNKFQLHEFGEVGVEEFKKDYCIHSMPFSYFMNIQDELDAVEIPYGLKMTTDDEEKQTANIYFENKNLERYSELGFNNIGQIHVYGSNNQNLQWDIQSQDEIVNFTTKTGEQEKKTYAILSGKNYIMKRNENECIWTVFKKDIRDLAEKEKKRNVVSEDLEKNNIFEELEKKVTEITPTLPDKSIEINLVDGKDDL